MHEILLQLRAQRALAVVGASIGVDDVERRLPTKNPPCNAAGRDGGVFLLVELHELVVPLGDSHTRRKLNRVPVCVIVWVIV
jgi:hypothetical protein